MKFWIDLDGCKRGIINIPFLSNNSPPTDNEWETQRHDLVINQNNFDLVIFFVYMQAYWFGICVEALDSI